ncbi:MAG: hypothetical protein KBC32_09255 [Candidatus Didemnitutus sp.]|nr:hypothetical protein [Candidatus Didemnitutus sp.]
MHYRSRGITVQRIMTDNGSCHCSAAFRKACAELGLKHLFTQPYTSRPMVRRSASSSPGYASGLMLTPTCTATNAPLGCRAGCKDTTGTDRTVPTMQTTRLQAQSGAQLHDDSLLADLRVYPVRHSGRTAGVPLDSRTSLVF